MLRHTLLAALLFSQPLAVAAQEQTNGIEFRFGLGPSLAPGYFGDDDLDVGAAAKFQLERLQLGGLALGGGDDYGIGLGGSVRIISERSADDFEELAGLEDIDATLELGGGLKFTAPNYDVFANLRYGVIGHEAFVAEVGSDIYFRPTNALTIKAGPRVLLGDDDYAQTYFGVTSAEAGASAFEFYDAQGGLMSAGAKAEAIYAINDDWEVVGTLQYEQLLEDAADSPITRSDDQFSGSIVLTRKITFGF